MLNYIILDSDIFCKTILQIIVLILFCKAFILLFRYSKRKVNVYRNNINKNRIDIKI